jgi:hypothetical protein
MHHPDLPAVVEDLDNNMTATLTQYEDAQVFAWARDIADQLADVRENRRRFGQLAAECRRRGYHWTSIAAASNLPLPTVHRLATAATEDQP